MAGKPTVEKIGGTSMSRFDEILRNVILRDRQLVGCRIGQQADQQPLEAPSPQSIDNFVDHLAQLFELWTAQPAPREYMRQATEALL